MKGREGEKEGGRKEGKREILKKKIVRTQGREAVVYCHGVEG
jgi:hypothetical protein